MLRRAGFDIGTLTFILPRQLDNFALEFLRLVGIPPAHIVAHDHTAELVQPDELIAPTVLRLRNRFNPLLGVASRFWLDRIEVPDTPQANRRVFVSRSAAQGNRTLTSRERIEARAVQAGYEIVFPERLTLPEQIALFRGARQIIGEYGSGLHGAIHAPTGAAICALRGTSHHPGFAQSGLAERFGHHLGYVFGDTPEFAEDQEMDITRDAFERALAAMEVWGER
jgi:capsular polysaccharide biosynthesis protein